MEPINIVALVGLIGSAIGYLFSRIDQRSVRARLRSDIKLLEMAPARSAAHASLEELVDKEAERLNRPWARVENQLLPRGVWILAVGIILVLVANGTRYSAFHYFDSFMTVYVSAGDGSGYELSAAANWVMGVASSLQTLGIAFGLLGAVTIVCSGVLRLVSRIVPRSIGRWMNLSRPAISSPPSQQKPVGASTPGGQQTTLGA
jgi:hypothetical protein